jgi:hypothetical protein
MKSLFAAFILGLASALPAAADEPPDFSAWPRLVQPFESTGGGGVMIDGYAPIVEGLVCTTGFTATLPDGQVLRNQATFDAVKTAGGVWCRNGRWRATVGEAKGATPFEMFIRDGVVFRKPG